MKTRTRDVWQPIYPAVMLMGVHCTLYNVFVYVLIIYSHDVYCTKCQKDRFGYNGRSVTFYYIGTIFTTCIRSTSKQVEIVLSRHECPSTTFFFQHVSISKRRGIHFQIGRSPYLSHETGASCKAQPLLKNLILDPVKKWDSVRNLPTSKDVHPSDLEFRRNVVQQPSGITNPFKVNIRLHLRLHCNLKSDEIALNTNLQCIKKLDVNNAIIIFSAQHPILFITKLLSIKI